MKVYEDSVLANLKLNLKYVTKRNHTKIEETKPNHILTFVVCFFVHTTLSQHCTLEGKRLIYSTELNSCSNG